MPTTTTLESTAHTLGLTMRITPSGLVEFTERNGIVHGPMGLLMAERHLDQLESLLEDQTSRRL